MLKKLVGYNLKIMGKPALAILIVLIVAGVIGCFAAFGITVTSSGASYNISSKALANTQAIFLIIGALAVCFCPLAMFILCGMRFYKNLFTDEGYLTFTLPVKNSTIYAAHFICALLTFGIIEILSVVFMTMIGSCAISGGEWSYVCSHMAKAFSDSLFSFSDNLNYILTSDSTTPAISASSLAIGIIETVVERLISSAFNIAVLFFAIERGARKLKGCVARSIAIYVGIIIAVIILTTIFGGFSPLTGSSGQTPYPVILNFVIHAICGVGAILLTVDALTKHLNIK